MIPPMSPSWLSHNQQYKYHKPALECRPLTIIRKGCSMKSGTFRLRYQLDLVLTFLML